MKLFVGKKRKDNKYPGTYVFSGNNRKIKKIITDKDIDKAINDGFQVSLSLKR